MRPLLPRRAAAALALAVTGTFAPAALPADSVKVESPNGQVALIVRTEGDRLSWSATLRAQPVIEQSALGILIDGVDLGQGAKLGRVERTRTDEKHPWRGVHTEAVDLSRGARIAVRHTESGRGYTVDVRAFDDAVAFRLEVPGTGRRVPDAATTFRLPPGSTVWYHGARDHYEGPYVRKLVGEVAAGEWAAPPLTFALPGGAGFASITEAALTDYAGMMLQADGQGGFAERLGHAVPASYPFTLRYGEAEARRLAAPAALEGAITTPWRVVLVGADLGALVNADAIAVLTRPPNPRLFPQGIRTPWLEPGRAVWRYMDGGENTFEGIKEFSRLAGELGFEYNLVEGVWQKWTDAQLRELVEYSKQRGVGIWLWRHSNTLHDREERRALFKKLHGFGVVGVKVDFLDHEAKEVIDLYQAILQDAAEFQLMVNFHGANKPAGEARSWPNEMTREGIRGMEYRSQPAWAEHDTTWPFTRLLAGHADFTPVVFGERRRDTTWAHQVASAAIVTSPLLVYAAHPASLLANPAVDIVRSLPSVWDETLVLPGSTIGELALFARRRGQTWFVAAMNGTTPLTVKVDLAFLGRGPLQALIVRDNLDNPAAVEVETREAGPRDVLEVPMRAGGGFVARFSIPPPPEPEPTSNSVNVAPHRAEGGVAEGAGGCDRDEYPPVLTNISGDLDSGRSQGGCVGDRHPPESPRAEGAGGCDRDEYPPELTNIKRRRNATPNSLGRVPHTSPESRRREPISVGRIADVPTSGSVSGAPRSGGPRWGVSGGELTPIAMRRDVPPLR